MCLQFVIIMSLLEPNIFPKCPNVAPSTYLDTAIFFYGKQY